MATFAAPARGAPSTMPSYPPIRITLTGSNDPACAPCSDWIALDGPIGKGSTANLARRLRSLGTRRLPVLVNSTGGSVTEAMAMGRLIRARHLDVAVARTVLTSCPGDRVACETPVPSRVEATGTPVEWNALCASACSFILAGGEHRFVSFHVHVGVHQFRSFRTLTRVVRMFRVLKRQVNGVPVEVSRTLVDERPVSSRVVQVTTSGAEYRDAQRYFTAMGIAPSLMELTEETDPQAIHWLSPAELVTTRMLTDSEDGAFLVAHTGTMASAKTH